MPPRTRQPAGPTPIEAISHADKRANLPTADAQEFITPDVESARSIVLLRDPTLDPQLVWRGKYPDGDPAKAGPLEADAPPIYIQEKIHPRVLIENLRRTAREGDAEPELTLFEAFDGLDDLDLVDFYRHRANWSNRMILGDSLKVMASLAEREDLRGQVQMIYIDPPYGIKFGSNWQASARKRDVKDGKVEDAAREAEQIKAFRDTWELGIHSYLSYLRDRLLIARELLTESGSCFVQMGDENVHIVRALMDEVFGPENLVSQLVVRTTSSMSADLLGNVADYILWYSRDRTAVKYRALYADKMFSEATAAQYRLVLESDGTQRSATRAELANPDGLAKGGRLFRLSDLTNQRPLGAGDVASFELDGITYRPGKGKFKTTLGGLTRLGWSQRLHPTSGGTLHYVRFLDDFSATPISNVWTDVGTGGFTDAKIYVVQTNTKIIDRCILMSTDPGDLVLDPTCGSGTTAYVAEQWGRRWITIDTSRVALALARQRLIGAKYPFYLLADSQKGRAKEQEVTKAPLPMTRTTDDIRHGFVYERVQHITLKSIANNPDIHEGMTRQQIDDAIKRHAEFEMLYDRPYEDKNTVRVAGPITVESLSPHRSLAFSGSNVGEGTSSESAAERAGAAQPDAANFEQSILENLSKAGVQNGRRGERIEFSSLEPYAGTYIQAVGHRKTGDGEDNGVQVRVGIAIGPQYGTVSQRFAKDAVREAIRAQDLDLLCVLGFAFDATTSEVTEADGVTVDTSSAGFAEVQGERSFGRIKLLLVRMNVDLLMGDELKKTGAGNLFTVFGEPDISLHADDANGQVTIELNGVDVYDPTTGEIRSNDTSRIALWMIDTNYNGDSFFVRHCYFTGGNDPYKRLKAALKAEIDADAWASLYATTSRPFERPETGKIAVKVINDYGDEVMKVFEVGKA